MASDELRTVLFPLLYREERATIWITENSCVCFEDDHAVDSHEKHFRFYLTEKDEHQSQHCLSIHASTLEEAIICLDYLVGLKDTHFLQMDISFKDHESLEGGGYGECPFGVNILEKILQNSARRIQFSEMVFTPDHGRILASSGTKTYICLYLCEFQDRGAAFVEAYASRQDETSGPANLFVDGHDNEFNSHNPFEDEDWNFFLSHQKLESLEIWGIGFSEVCGRDVATAEVQRLTLGSIDFEDEGAALVESVRQGRGPKDLCFADNCHLSSERLVAFMNALRGNTNLERLHGLLLDSQVTRALAAALHENKGLVHLTAYFGALNAIDWTELLEAISLHPSLRSLDLTMQQSNSDILLEKRREVTEAVADMLSINEQVEVMSFHDGTFDKDDWNTNVVPRLECNVYRKRFPSIQRIGEASTRAAVLARALAKFASKPHLVLMLLNQNHDIVSSYLDSSAFTHDDEISIPSRKRSRSLELISDAAIDQIVLILRQASYPIEEDASDPDSDSNDSDASHLHATDPATGA
jgi:hypothetical protein